MSDPVTDEHAEREARIDACTAHHPLFDEAAYRAENMQIPPNVVRQRWPRFVGKCECGFNGIAYASFLHYIAGDW